LETVVPPDGVIPEFGKESNMEYLFLGLLFLIAFLYSSVGHGGASGYLALMALFGIAPAFMKSTSLTLNVFVSLIAFIAYAKAGYFKLKLVLPFVLTSVPMAFAGALFPVKANIYEIILAVFLLFAVGRMLFTPGAVAEKSSQPPVMLALLIGAVLGFFSGMIGIGGGIILSPLLILFHWANVKESAAVSSLFILLNSISGLSALLINGFHYNSNLVLWIVTGILGGITGSWMGSTKVPQGKLKHILAAVLLMASLKLFLY
jgi:uncharacterized membrane protein YfcA